MYECKPLVLGDFDSFYDIFVETSMGHVSFYQMVYFVMVTVSTAGAYTRPLFSST